MAAGAWRGKPMASLIMAVTVLPWVALTVPGWAVQAMADPVHTAVLEVAAEATVAPVPTAVCRSARRRSTVAAAQAMAAPVPTWWSWRRRSRVWWTRSLRRSRWRLSWRSGRPRRWPGLWRLWPGARVPTSQTKLSSRRAARAALLLFSPFALDRAFASNVSREPKRKTRSRW